MGKNISRRNEGKLRDYLNSQSKKKIEIKTVFKKKDDRNIQNNKPNR